MVKTDRIILGILGILVLILLVNTVSGQTETFKFTDWWNANTGTTTFLRQNGHSYLTPGSAPSCNPVNRQKICDLKGYDNVIGYSQGQFANCGDDFIYTWSETKQKFVEVPGCNWNCYLLKLTCSREACTTTCEAEGVECGSPANLCAGTLNCGTCDAANGANSCNSSFMCQPACNAGWGDCDGNGKNGCETELSTDTNCGACGNVCGAGSTCENNQCTVTGTTSWRNMKNEPVVAVDLRDTVKLVLFNPNVDITGKEINYTIYKNAPFWFDSEISQGGNESSATWFANESGNYYFTVDFDDEIIDSRDYPNGILNVKDFEGNYVPVVEITEPGSGDKFLVDTEINFSIIFGDEDDDLSVFWDFGDGSTTIVENCLSETNCNIITHIYDTSGTKVVTVIVNETGREQTAVFRTRIFVYEDGTNVFPIISKPEINEVIEGTRIVEFNGKESYVAKCSSSCSENLSCYTVGNTTDNLSCYNLDNVLIEMGDFELSFKWEFSDGTSLNGTWSQNYGEIVEFSRAFYIPTRHWARLKVEYTDVNTIEISDFTDTYFRVTSNNPVCGVKDNVGYWGVWDGTGFTETNSMSDCIRSNGWPSTTCCPESSECVLDPSDANYRQCKGQPAPLLCSDYNAERYDGDSDLAEAACKGFTKDVGVRSVENLAGVSGYCGSSETYLNDSGNTCRWLIENCGCSWNANASACEARFSKVEMNCIADEPEITGECQYTTSQKQGDCKEDDFITYSWNAVWTGSNSTKPIECAAGEQRFSCEAVTKLPFFGILNLLIAASLIAVIYFFRFEQK